MHKDSNVFISWVFRGLCRFENINSEGQIKISWGGKPNDYSITVLDRGGSSQMITVDYNRGRGVLKNSKNDYVIFEQPLIELLCGF